MTEATLFSVVQLGQFPTTRDLGRVGRDRLEDLVADKHHVDLTIDFSGVTAMTISFADEFLGRFLASFDGTTLDATLKVAGLNAENQYAVVVCVDRRRSNVVVLEEAGTLTLVGDDPILPETFDVALGLGTFKANDIATAMSLSAPNANNRLKRLTEVGALRKTRVTGSGRGGKEFTYQAVTADIPDGEALTNA
jgi:hypothetical protein